MFVNKYNLDKSQLGPWFKPAKKDPLADPKSEKRYVAKEVKELKQKHSRVEKLSPMA